MARERNKLTALKVANLKEPGRCGDGAGLYVQVGESGTKSWLFRYQINGRERFMGLGSVNDFSLKEARERARGKRQLLADGVDPLEARRKERAERALAAKRMITFEEAAKAYFDQHASKWRNAKHRSEFLSSLRRYAFRHIGKIDVAEIDTPLVLKCVEPIWPDKTETANRTRGRIEAILDWATVRGHRTGDNPARWRGHLDNVLPRRSQIQRVKHHPALPFGELTEFMQQLRHREGIAAMALEFLILTAARTGEVIGARWDEVDLDKKIWTVPGNRMKAGKKHRVPLSNRATELLEALPREAGNDHVFISTTTRGRPLSNMAMNQLLRRMGRGDITVHGFRSTFRDWAAEQTSYPNHVVEMALAHTISSSVEKAYRRGDLLEKRVRLMTEWAKFADAKPAAATAEIVPIRGRRAAK